MSLRTRIAALVAGTVLLASLIGGVGVAVSSRNVGLDRVDQALASDADQLPVTAIGLETQLRFAVDLRRAACESDVDAETSASTETVDEGADATDPGGGQISGPRPGTPRSSAERLARVIPEFSSALQVVRPNGTVISACVALPVDADDTAIAASGTGRRFRTVSIDGERHRVMTTGVGATGAMQFARSLELTEDTMRALFARTAVFGALGAVLAGLVGWAVARRATRPIERLRAATDRVAHTRDLGERIPVEGKDEIGDLAASFNTMLESLDASREQQQRLVQDAGHELRTPLTSLRTNVELLQRHGDIPDEMRARVLDDISAELGELTALTGELVVSATEVPTVLVQRSPFDLAELADECVEQARRRHRRSIDVRHTPAENTMAVGDPTLVARAITNLVNNAAKFASDETGPIEVVTHRTSLWVLDRGPGIAEADLPFVFDRFYRATAARSAPGSGLGLSIVKQIVDGHGGSLHVANRADGGLEIGFSLPASDSA